MYGRHPNTVQCADHLELRFRRIALRIGTAGLVIVASVFALAAMLGEVTTQTALETAAYVLVLGTISLASIRDYQVRLVFYSGLLLLFAIFWSSSFALYYAGQLNSIRLPLVVFCPIFICLALDYRLLAVLAPVQSVLVYFYFQHGAVALGGAAEGFDPVGFSFAVLSGFMFGLLALLAWVRQNTDDELICLIADKVRLASTDSLTGLMNRRAFMETLNSCWVSEAPFVVAFLDLDRFKPLNDQYGHAAGDAVLKHVADRLKEYPGVRAAARMGGDEFAVALDLGLSETELNSAMASLHHSLTQDMEWEAKVLSVGTSIGYATNIKDAPTLSALLKAADTAMRRAKAHHAGWVCFNPDIDGAALDTQSQEIEFRSALIRGDIRASLQPIADATTREVVGYELLSRWTQCDLLETPEPAEFIPIAERLGLLNDLLWKSLDETLKGAALNPLRLSVNISPAQLQAPDFLDHFLNVLKGHAVDPSCIILEITEQVAYRNIESNIQVLEKARRAGMLIALDDFGTGYSSLSILDKLPLDKIKIDKSFSQRSEWTDRSDSILHASIRLANQLNLSCCVEGIETEEAALKVASLGADEIQGYWIGKPQLVQDSRLHLKRAS